MDKSNARALTRRFRGLDFGKLNTAAEISSASTVPNPYLDEFMRINGGSNWNAFGYRGALVQKYAWAVPNALALNKIAQLQQPKVGAGTGYWASLLQRRSVEVECFDNAVRPKADQFAAVRHGGPDALSRAGMRYSGAGVDERILFLCWPPYEDPMAAQCLERFHGDTLIYIGEGEGGCTADDKFHEMLDQQWELLENVAIPQWNGLHDSMHIYRRRLP